MSILYPDKRTPILSPAYDFVATLPYIQDNRLALSFGGSSRLSEISPDQIRRFADVARLPLSSVSQRVMETVDRTVAAWVALEEKELLPKNMKNAIDQQIKLVASNTQNHFYTSS